VVIIFIISSIEDRLVGGTRGPGACQSTFPAWMSRVAVILISSAPVVKVRLQTCHTKESKLWRGTAFCSVKGGD